jgi:hypothetical protein
VFDAIGNPLFATNKKLTGRVGEYLEDAQFAAIVLFKFAGIRLLPVSAVMIVNKLI